MLASGPSRNSISFVGASAVSTIAEENRSMLVVRLANEASRTRRQTPRARRRNRDRKATLRVAIEPFAGAGNCRFAESPTPIPARPTRLGVRWQCAPDFPSTLLITTPVISYVSRAAVLLRLRRRPHRKHPQPTTHQHRKKHPQHNVLASRSHLRHRHRVQIQRRLITGIHRNRTNMAAERRKARRHRDSSPSAAFERNRLIASRRQMRRTYSCPSYYSATKSPAEHSDPSESNTPSKHAGLPFKFTVPCRLPVWLLTTTRIGVPAAPGTTTNSCCSKSASP